LPWATARPARPTTKAAASSRRAHRPPTNRLVSLDDTAVGTLMGALLGNVTFEGWAARFSYRMLYRAHQRALHGSLRAMILWISDLLTRRTRPRLKLH